MNILAFDTSTEIFSVCLVTNQKSFEFSCSQGYKHSETLVTEIDLLLKKAEISTSDLDLIVCPSGPGSFTGLRIGMSTAKGISFGSDTPMVTVPTLDMMAYGLNFFDGLIVPVIDARKKRFYTAFYTKDEKISDYLDLTPEDIFARITNYDRVLLTGPDAKAFSDLLEIKTNISVDPMCSRGWACNLIHLGQKQYDRFGSSPDTEGPIYLRRSEAEIGITMKS